MARHPKKRLSWGAFTPNVVYAGVFFLITFLCYILVPDKLPGQTPIFQRFSTIVILAFIMLISIPLKGADTPRFKYFVIITVGLYSLLWAEYMVSFNKENENFNEALFEGMEVQQTLAGLIYDNQYRGRKVYIHFPNYYIVWKRGIAASKIIDYRFGVVRRAKSKAALPFYHELIGEDYHYQPQYRDVGWLLVRGLAPRTPDPNLQHFRLYRKSGQWSLYENRKRTGI